MRWINTRLQHTSSVSRLLEKVCVWKVQVTYDDATRGTATRRARGDSTSSWTAQSSMTTLRASIITRSAQYTTDGETS
jgi:hypothetical protein